MLTATPPLWKKLSSQIHQAVTTHGTRIAVVHDVHAKNDAVALSFRVGMRNELPGEEGFLHLLEHLVYQDSIFEDAVTRELQLHAKGGILGAHTHMEYVEFFEMAAKGFASAMTERLVGQVFYPALLADQITQQIHAVALERKTRLAKAPGQILPWPHLTSLMWLDHAHSHDATGDLDLLARADQEALRAFHTKHFTPANATLVAVTSSNPIKTLDSLKNTFERIAPTGTEIIQEPLPAATRITENVMQRVIVDSESESVQTTRKNRKIHVSPLPDSLPAVGFLILAAVLKNAEGLDASAGLFGPLDIAQNDLFVIVDDSGLDISFAERVLSACHVSDQTLTTAIANVHFSLDSVVHDDLLLARTVARDLVLRANPEFVAQTAQELNQAVMNLDHLRNQLRESAQVLATQPLATISISAEEQP